MVVVSLITSISKGIFPMEEVLEVVDEDKKSSDSSETVEPDCWMWWFCIGIVIEEAWLQYPKGRPK
jgi:hypothetical protein